MKRYNPKGKPTKAELEWMGRVAQLPCIVSGRRPIEIHHIPECGRRHGCDYVLPLAPDVHKNISRIKYAEQMRLCKRIWQMLGREWQEPVTKIVPKRIKRKAV